MHNLKVESMFICGQKAEDMGQEAASQINSRGRCSRDKGGARICRGYLQQKPGGSGTSKDYLIIKNQTSPVNEFSAFLYGKDARAWAL